METTLSTTTCIIRQAASEFEMNDACRNRYHLLGIRPGRDLCLASLLFFSRADLALTYDPPFLGASVSLPSIHADSVDMGGDRNNK